MNHLGSCNAQYANNLASLKQLVLRTDRDSGDNPQIDFYVDNENEILLCRIYNSVKIEEMQSNPNKGAKSRTDIHFNDTQLNVIINILTPFIESINIDFDDTQRTAPDPTGTEYHGGMPLGRTNAITWIPAEIKANYYDLDFSVLATRIYIDAEHYVKGYKYHIGATMSENFYQCSENENCFELRIKYVHLKRFLHSMIVAKMWFNN